MKRLDILKEAGEVISKDRNATHGEPEDSFAAIAKLWGAYLDMVFSPADAAVMLALLKVARLKHNPDNKDNWLDAVGYFACGYEANMKKDKVPGCANQPAYKSWAEIAAANSPQLGEGYHVKLA